MRPQLNGGTLARQEKHRELELARFSCSGRQPVASRELGVDVSTVRRLGLIPFRSRVGFRGRLALARPRAGERASLLGLREPISAANFCFDLQPYALHRPGLIRLRGPRLPPGTSCLPCRSRAALFRVCSVSRPVNTRASWHLRRAGLPRPPPRRTQLSNMPLQADGRSSSSPAASSLSPVVDYHGLVST